MLNLLLSVVAGLCSLNLAIHGHILYFCRPAMRTAINTLGIPLTNDETDIFGPSDTDLHLFEGYMYLPEKITSYIAYKIVFMT